MQLARNQYLQAMGIQVWHLRETLPGAKHVSDVDLGTLAAIPAVTHESVDAIDSTESPNPVAASVLSEAAVAEALTAAIPAQVSPQTAPTEANIAPQQPVPVVAKQNVAIEENPEFRLASIVFPGCCVVVTEVARQAVEPIAKPQLTFLKELLLSMGAEIPEQPIITLFNWPMLRTAGFDQSAAAASEACQAFLRGQKSKHTLSFVLLMGEQPGRFMLNENSSFEDVKGRLLQATEQPHLLSYSVDKLFEKPMLKSQLWHDIQPLRVWLQQQE